MATMLTKWSKSGNKLERIYLLAKIEFKLRYYENRLGLLWAFIKPLMDLSIYYVVFKTILKQDVPNFASFLFIGLIFFNFFLESTTGTIQILKTKKYLYEYSNMDKLDIYISTILSNTIGLLFNLVIFLVFYLFIERGGNHLTFKFLYVIPMFLTVFILSLGFSLILSNIYVVAKDIHQIWTVFTNFFFFVSPIFYRLSTFRENVPGADYINPIAGIIINVRKAVIYDENPEWKLLWFDFGYATIILLLGLYLLNKLGSKASEKL
ncbi:MAG: ABC transporter permease [Niastella sp.]|jgi:ABC-2 type transport system permease protein|uniref:ABC transporter permease n=1 Tax=Niastella sp. TaxID=1869183 RepID=UPI00389AEEE3